MDPYPAPDRSGSRQSLCSAAIRITASGHGRASDSACHSLSPTFSTGAGRCSRTRIWTCLSIVWGVMGINWAISVGMNVMLSGLVNITRDEAMYRLLYILTLFGSVVLQIWVVWIGQTIALLKIARGEPVAFEDVFKGGRLLLTMILATIVMLAVLAVPILIAVGRHHRGHDHNPGPIRSRRRATCFWL